MMLWLREKRLITQQEVRMNYIKVAFFLYFLFHLGPTIAADQFLSNSLSEEALQESKRDISAAILLVQQSVVADPNNAKAWTIAGQIYLLNEDISSAERFYNKAKKILKWKPKTNFTQLVKEMVKEDLKFFK